MSPPYLVDVDLQKKVFDCVAKNNVSELNVLLKNFQGDIFDEHGMTPLQHAAYKGNKEIVQLLLDQVSGYFIITTRQIVGLSLVK